MSDRAIDRIRISITNAPPVYSARRARFSKTIFRVVRANTLNTPIAYRDRLDGESRIRVAKLNRIRARAGVRTGLNLIYFPRN